MVENLPSMREKFHPTNQKKKNKICILTTKKKKKKGK
jgi:hypothetical protein